jgi:hypothetical protein
LLYEYHLAPEGRSGRSCEGGQEKITANGGE